MDAVQYRDSDHTYWCRGKRYLSATQVLEPFKNKFDGAAVAEEYKDKAGRDKSYWLKEWDSTRVKSLVRGNGIHQEQEDITNNRGTEVWQGTPVRVRNAEMLPDWLPLSAYPDGIYTEKKLWHHGYHIAGKADKLILFTLGDKRVLNIDDYKTNKLIRFQSFCHPKTGPQMMKAPLNHLQDCSGVHYTLQLSLYQFMGESQGCEPGECTLIHYPHILDIAPAGALPPPPKRYPVPYLKKEVTSMLDYLQGRGII